MYFQLLALFLRTSSEFRQLEIITTRTKNLSFGSQAIALVEPETHLTAIFASCLLAEITLCLVGLFLGATMQYLKTSKQTA